MFVDGKEIYYTGGVFIPPSNQRPKSSCTHANFAPAPAEAAKAASAVCPQ